MKKLEELDKKMPHPDPDSNPEIAAKQQEDISSYRRMLRLLCINVRAKDANDADLCDQARMKLSCTEQTALLEDSEFKAVQERVERNELNWPTWMQADVQRYMREAAKKKIEIKEA